MRSRSGVFQWNIFASWVFMMRSRKSRRRRHTSHLIHASITNCRVLVSVLSLQSKKIKRVGHSSLAAKTCSMLSFQEHLDWVRTMREQMTRGEFVLENHEQFITARPSILVTDCRSLFDAILKEGAAPRQQTRDWQLSWP